MGTSGITGSGRTARSRSSRSRTPSRSSLGRPLDWIHLPVEGDSVDLRFFETLGQLSLRPETRLYLGLLHLSDGVVGAKARIVAAQRFIHDFGVATDCGWGRHRTQDVDALVDLHLAVTSGADASERATRTFAWPGDWKRVPDEDWTTDPVDDFGAAYDSVDKHGWYRNLDPTVEELAHLLDDGDIMIDYSGGTGILLDRLKLRMFDVQNGAVIVDSSPKFLRVAVEKFRDDPKVGFRLLRFLKDEKRLQRFEEVLGAELIERGVDVIASTNAVHLYPDLPDTVASWVKVLRPGGHVLINSGNIRNPRARRSEWILDETVWVVGDLAEGLVRTDPAYAAYIPDLDNAERMKAHAAYRDQRLPPAAAAGLLPRDARARRPEGGVGARGQRRSGCAGLVRVPGRVPRRGARLGGRHREGRRREAVEQAVADRLALMRHAMETLFHGRPTFQACWTYITCVNGR